MPVKTLSIAFGILFSTLSIFGQSGSVADQVRTLDKKQRDAALRGEISFGKQFLATDYVSINPAGVLSTRKDALAALESGEVSLQSIDVDQEEVHVYGDTAVVTGHERVRGRSKGQAFEAEARYSRVWIRQNGVWKLVLFQETPLAPARR
jgi:ketosteroid isomerase-like protein